MPGIMDLLNIGGIKPASTADQVMRNTKSAQLLPFMLGGPNMPTQNLGEVGPAYPGGRTDAEQVAGVPVPPRLQPGQPERPAAPPPAQDPMGQDVTADAAQAALERFPASGGGLPVQPSGVGGQPAAATPRADQPAADPSQPLREFRQRKRDVMIRSAQLLMSKGSPATQVRGLQMMFEVQKDIQEELEADQKKAKAEEELQKGLGFIDEVAAGDEEKRNAKAMLKLGIEPKQLPEVLRINDAGYKQAAERREQFTKWGAGVTQASRDLGTIEVNAKRAEEILDKGNMTTGIGGWAASFVPGSAHNQLKQALAPLEALTGYGYLQEMREQSKTGGAVGNVTENETRWLMGIQGSLDPVNNAPDVLKENIRTIVAGKRIVAEMKKLAPALEAGDPKAWDTYGKLTQQLAENGATVAARIKADNRKIDAMPDSEFEARYGASSNANR